MNEKKFYKHLSPTSLASRTLAHRLNRPEYFWEGTSSRVVLTSPHRVTKVTSCPATAALLEELATCPVPGLPRVYRCLGVVALDTNEPGAPEMKAFEMDLLAHSDLRGDATLCVNYTQWTHHAMRGLVFGISPAQDVEMALKLRDHPHLRTPAAWDFIADFLPRHDAVLDAPVLRNVMLTRTGEICLADPVSFNPTSL